MGLWDRMFSRQGSPEADWISVAGDEVSFERQADGVRVWRLADGDALGIYFIRLVPDLPRATTASEFTARYAEMLSGPEVALVSSELVDLAGFRALRSIVKVRQLPHGMTYVGAFTIPFATCSYVIKVQCEERGTTGTREAVLLDRKLREGGTPEAALREIATQVDDPAHDRSFPDHPVARARRHMHTIQMCVRVDERLRTARPFGLP